MRNDNREWDEIRKMEMRVGVLKNANGSSFVRMGKTFGVAAVYGPKSLYPKFLQNFDRAILRCFYSMTPFSVMDRKRPGPDRRSTEISKVIKESLYPAVFLENFSRTSIDIFVHIEQADAGTRCV